VGHPQQGAWARRVHTGSAVSPLLVRLTRRPNARSLAPPPRGAAPQESYLARQREIAEFKAWLATQPYDDEILGEQAAE
jgi:hypothetical protein